MSNVKGDPYFERAINMFADAVLSGDQEVKIAPALALLIEGMKRRQPHPPNALFDMAIDHCNRAAKADQGWRLSQIATALQQFSAALR
jgi:hypothetical protein